nr:MAG TPA: hypothetical protein [Caudoviricetes sp.]
MKEQRENRQATFGYMPQDYVRAAQMRRKEAAAARLAARRQAAEEEAVQKAFSRLDREKQNRAENASGSPHQTQSEAAGSVWQARRAADLEIQRTVRMRLWRSRNLYIRTARAMYLQAHRLLNIAILHKRAGHAVRGAAAMLFSRLLCRRYRHLEDLGISRAIRKSRLRRVL